MYIVCIINYILHLNLNSSVIIVYINLILYIKRRKDADHLYLKSECSQFYLELHICTII